MSSLPLYFLLFFLLSRLVVFFLSLRVLPFRSPFFALFEFLFSWSFIVALFCLSTTLLTEFILYLCKGLQNSLFLFSFSTKKLSFVCFLFLVGNFWHLFVQCLVFFSVSWKMVSCVLFLKNVLFGFLFHSSFKKSVSTFLLSCFDVSTKMLFFLTNWVNIFLFFSFCLFSFLLFLFKQMLKITFNFKTLLEFPF